MDTKTLWNNCLDNIAGHVSPQHFTTWFRPIKAVEANGTIELSVPNRFFLEWVREHYLLLIQDVLDRLAKKEVKIVWTIADEASPNVKPGQKGASKEGLAAGTKALKANSAIELNPKYNFENFVVGNNNKFAHAACTAVANKPADKYNPLFIYGGVGLGKTHLLQAIGHRVLENNPGARVCYYTSERFMNEFINYVSHQKMADFRGRFRNVDILLIDDIQFWAGKERTQEEFFHTFNALHESHKQIVVTSDKFLKDIEGIEERLRSRFEGGLVADIKPPDMETKIAILRIKAAQEGIRLPDDVADFLASVSKSNIRELEGNLNRVIAVASLTGQEITLQTSKDALKSIIKESAEKTVSMDEILKAVSLFYNIKPSDLKSEKRHRNISLPRQIAMFFAREYGKYSFPEIGAAFGGKDHSTAIHGVKKIKTTLKDDVELKHSIKTLKQNLGIN